MWVAGDIHEAVGATQVEIKVHLAEEERSDARAKLAETHSEIVEGTSLHVVVSLYYSRKVVFMAGRKRFSVHITASTSDKIQQQCNTHVVLDQTSLTLTT
jgi:hypothetical protein